MNGVEKRLRLLQQALAGATPNRFIGGADVEHFSLGRIGHPEDFAHIFRQLAQMLFAVARSRLCQGALNQNFHRSAWRDIYSFEPADGKKILSK